MRYLLFILILLVSPSLRAARTDCSTQMALADTAGDAITTSVDYEIHFYSALTGGTEISTAVTGSDTPSRGILNIQFDCAAVTANNAVFMEYLINGETLTPRVEMVSTPFASVASSVAGNSITLGTDTIGNYVESLTAGTGISITGGSGEGAALTISATGAVALSTGDVTTTTILDGTITSADLEDSSVTSAKIAADTITAADIAADAVGSSEIATGAVTTNEILDGTITGGDIENNAIDFTQLVDSMTLDASTSITINGSSTFSLKNRGTGYSFYVDDQNGDLTPFIIDADGNIGVGNTSPAGRLVVSPPPTQTLANGDTITADACGTIKKISITGATITDTTNTFTTPSSANDGCCMDIILVDTAPGLILTLDANPNFKTNGGTNQMMDVNDALRVCSTGVAGFWHQVSAIMSND